MDVVWNLATIEDSPLLARLNLELIADEGHPNPMNALELEARMRGWLSTEYRAVLFRREARVVAYALFRDDEWNRIYLRQFFVVRDARRQGVGRAAVELLKREVVPGTPVVLEVLTTNAAGRAFWSATGFREYCLALKWEPGDVASGQVASRQESGGAGES